MTQYKRQYKNKDRHSQIAVVADVGEEWQGDRTDRRRRAHERADGGTHRPLVGVDEEDLDDDLKLSPARLSDLIWRLGDHYTKKTTIFNFPSNTIDI